MSIEFCRACINIAACVCAKDGIISEAEESEMYRVLKTEFPNIDEASFDEMLTHFFDSEAQIEHYLLQIVDEKLRLFILTLAEKSAAADGLAIQENIALDKIYMTWGVSRNA